MNSRRETSIRISFSRWQSDLRLPFPFHVVKSVFPAVSKLWLNRKVFLVKILPPLLVPYIQQNKKYLVFNVDEIKCEFRDYFRNREIKVKRDANIT